MRLIPGTDVAVPGPDAALFEMGHLYLGDLCYLNRGGCPSFRWRDLGRLPTYAEVLITHRAFDLWYKKLWWTTDRPWNFEGGEWGCACDTLEARAFCWWTLIQDYDREMFGIGRGQCLELKWADWNTPKMKDFPYLVDRDTGDFLDSDSIDRIRQELREHLSRTDTDEPTSNK